ncbi:hypothetical protein SERLA73DRAFT_80061 [Serpula lacrymans var. lacrymans S7.3]|uniref:Arrestin C-terminal-like domain-containing protein n=2 Tax=Serpula lacrymans var. lacrymans TaxID=341189 RepID=F8QIK0_SERL3|nr:uncharacterized protein SERLADRAFT_436102 [Serpula lacrymans var. lacrymans S7.9]EGN91882.1 hypothetical protein SERLA73DRAFT_80061 [Serpula lacrymans var. lacrymans S7.3]EGO26282.1 hypothetical protein SERLADRAFT_436102 [Serpula lacrymans var. lacrymans S7.9]
MSKIRSDKNTLAIRLTESVVYLRTNDPTGRRRTQDDVAPSMIRGLLTLNIAKPTRISSIELELQGKVTTSWPEGVGARRIEVTESHKIFSASTVFFRAGSTPSTRRTASVGPGLFLQHDHDEDEIHTPARRSATATPRNETEPVMARSPTVTRAVSANPATSEHVRTSRRVSADNAVLHREIHSHQEHSLPSPPYTPAAHSSFVFDGRPGLSPSHTNSFPTNCPQVWPLGRLDDNPAQTLEDLRQALRNLESGKTSPSLHAQGNILQNPPSSSASSIHSHRDTSLSRRPSIDNVDEDESTLNMSMTSPPASYLQSPVTLSPTPSKVNANSPESPDEGRGRKHTRFSLAAVSSVFMGAVKDRVRSSSPRSFVATEQRRHGRSLDMHRDKERGRTLDKGKARVHDANRMPVQHKERSTLGKVGEMLGLESDERKDSGEGWKEFKKGTYTYPISFTIPANSPPTIECDYGSMAWRLKAEVHRPGAFRSKMTASREVVIVSSPGEEDTEETENIIIERQWDSQLQYLIAVSGRSFHIGGTMPIQITILPLTKAKVHRISIHLEERVDYYTQMKRIARSEPVHRVTLLSLRNRDSDKDNDSDAILPLVSDDPEAFKNSPFYDLLKPDEDCSEMASSLMGPGPWTFNHELQLPNSCASLHFTNRNKKGSIMIGHVLKIIFRVERGDDEAMDLKTGKKKLFDIVVQTPVHILSCRCNPEWVSLPRYSEALENACTTSYSSCPCETKRVRGMCSAQDVDGQRQALDRVASRRSSDSAASTAENQAPVNPLTMPSLRNGIDNTDTLANRNIQYERLISGQESEMGDAPPAYENVVQQGRAVSAVR